MKRISPKQHLLHGAAWWVGARWTIKVFGFVNTIIMARLLMPSDYGVVGMATLIVGLVQTFLDFGAGTALLRKNHLTRDEIDSAWTLRLIQSCFIGIFLLISIPFAIDFFNEDRLELILIVFAISVALTGINNIGPILAQKDFDFKLDFKITTLSKLASVAVTITTGYILRDYRALMLGVVAGYITPLILSYAWHSYRPHWNTSKISEIWGITKWLMFTNISQYIMNNTDQFVAGRIGSSIEYGTYSVGRDLGGLPVGEIGPAMLRALLPVLSSIQEDDQRTRSAVIKTISAINTIIWPIGIGFMALSTQTTEIILGDKWLSAIPYVSVFSLVATLQTSCAPATTLLVLRGYTRAQSVVVWLEFASFIIAALLLVPTFHLLGLAYAWVLGSIVRSSLTLTTAKFKCELSLKEVFQAISRPVIGALIMGYLVLQVTQTIENMFLSVATGVIIGSLFYSIWSIITWHLMSRPEGLESTIYDKFFPGDRHIKQ